MMTTTGSASKNESINLPPLFKNSTLNDTSRSRESGPLSNSLRGKLNKSLTNSTTRNSLSNSALLNSSGKPGKLLPMHSEESPGRESYTLDKVMKVINSKYSAQHVDRHIYVIQKFVENRDAFFVDEARDLNKTVLYCFDQGSTDGRDEFLLSMHNILQLCAKPLKYRASGDHLNRIPAYTDILDCIVRAIRIPFIRALDVKIDALKALCQFIDNEPVQEFIENLLEQSSVADDLKEELISIVGRVAAKEELFKTMIRTIKSFTYFPCCCRRFTINGTIGEIVKIIAGIEFTEEIFSDCIDILWNILDMNEPARETLGTVETVHVLFGKIQKIFSKGYGLRDKELRNDILVISSYLAQQQSSQVFFKDTGYLEFLEYYSIVVETTDLREVKITPNEEDFEMKKLMWNILFFLTFDDECLTSLLQGSFLEVLLGYLKGLGSPTGTVKSSWNENQMIELQLLVLKILFIICVRVPDEFVRYDGCEICLKFVQNSSHETLFSAALSVVMNSATTEAGSTALSNLATLELMLRIAIDKEYSMTARRDALQVITSLCSFLPENKKVLVELGGIQKINTLLQIDKRSLDKRDDFIFIVVDCVWTCMLGDPEVEAEFIKSDGVFQLMCMLENGSHWIKIPLLSCLIDMMSINEDIVHEVTEWKSLETKKNGPQLILSLWNSAIDTEDVKQLISDQTINQEVSIITSTSEETVSIPEFNISHLELNLRKKIFYVLTLMGIDSIPQLLTHDEQVLLETVKRYNDILLDKVWGQISADLDSEGIRPTTPDQQKIEEMSHTSEKRKVEMTQNEAKIYAVHEEKKKGIEESFYDTIRQKQKEKKKFTSGLSVMEIKLRKAKMLNAGSIINLAKPVFRVETNSLSENRAEETMAPPVSVREKINDMVFKTAH